MDSNLMKIIRQDLQDRVDFLLFGFPGQTKKSIRHRRRH